MKKLKILVVCGNGLGSSNMGKMALDAILADEKIVADVMACDTTKAKAEESDLIVTVAELATQFSSTFKVAIISSYTNRKKITAEVLPIIKELI